MVEDYLAYLGIKLVINLVDTTDKFVYIYYMFNKGQRFLHTRTGHQAEIRDVHITKNNTIFYKLEGLTTGIDVTMKQDELNDWLDMNVLQVKELRPHGFQ